MFSLVGLSPSLAKAQDPPSTEVIGADLKAIQSLLPVNAIHCLAELKRLGVATDKAAASCAFLNASSNPWPPDRLEGTGWSEFVASKEFRGFAHLDRYRLTCREGRVDRVTPLGVSGTSPGWTEDIPGVFVKGERYDEYWGLFKREEPIITVAPDGRSVSMALRTAQRLANPTRTAQYPVLRHDAPFIWIALHQRLGCDGSKQATVTYSDMPSLSAFVDGRAKVRDEQTSELARFIQSGGVLLNLNGRGNLDWVCGARSLNVPGYSPVRIPSRLLRADCRNGIDTGFLTSTPAPPIPDPTVPVATTFKADLRLESAVDSSRSASLDLRSLGNLDGSPLALLTRVRQLGRIVGHIRSGLEPVAFPTVAATLTRDGSRLVGQRSYNSQPCHRVPR
jgi:hypothetical protein